MHAPKNPALFAPILTPEQAAWVAEMDRFSVPFGAEMNGRWVSTPPSAWRRVFNGPQGADGKPLNCGGIPARIVNVMRAELLKLPGHRRSRSSTLPAPPPGCFILGAHSAAGDAPPARNPAANGAPPLTAPQAPTTKASK